MAKKLKFKNIFTNDEELENKNATISIDIKEIKNIFIMGIIMLIIIMFLMLFVVFTYVFEFDGDSSAYNGLYYSNMCPEMTVNIYESDINGEQIYKETKTYNFDEYLLGVVYAEFEEANNLEVYKSLAISARTKAIYYSSDCTIDSSSEIQLFDKKAINTNNETTQMIKQAIKETSGKFITINNELVDVEYDNFCFVEKNANYYILSDQQSTQQIPVEWANNNIKKYQYLNCPCEEFANPSQSIDCYENKIYVDGGHGIGMSKYGALYLAKELGYTYENILKYYYGEDINLTSNRATVINDLDVKLTSNAHEIKENLSTFLNYNGSSINEMNNFIKSNVENNGAGTRDGVITAAVSFINYLYDNYNVKLPYYWGGKYNQLGVDPNFGDYSPSVPSRTGNVSYYKSFDCSGFINWTIRNGGYNFSPASTSSIDSYFTDDVKCDIRNASCVGEPGDLINMPNGHVVMIIFVDNDSQKYIIAESGNSGVALTEQKMHTPFSSNSVTSIISMNSFYNNENNINKNY